MKIALCIGHSRWICDRRDGGAVSLGGISEWDYWVRNVPHLERVLEDAGHCTHVWDNYRGSGYSTAMRWLAGEIRGEACDLAVELHFNSAHGSAHGAEWLHWHTSDSGLVLASAVRHQFAQDFPESRDRGIKKIARGNRGDMFLRLTHCPALIAEPFFGSNRADWLMGDQRAQDVAESIGRGILRYCVSNE